jgi:hypothetical protein
VRARARLRGAAVAAQRGQRRRLRAARQAPPASRERQVAEQQGVASRRKQQPAACSAHALLHHIRGHIEHDAGFAERAPTEIDQCEREPILQRHLAQRRMDAGEQLAHTSGPLDDAVIRARWGRAAVTLGHADGDSLQPDREGFVAGRGQPAESSLRQSRLEQRFERLGRADEVPERAGQHVPGESHPLGPPGAAAARRDGHEHLVTILLAASDGLGQSSEGRPSAPRVGSGRGSGRDSAGDHRGASIR